MKLSLDPRLPVPGAPDAQKSTYARLYELFRSHAQAVNAVDDAGTQNASDIATNAAAIATKADQTDLVELINNAQWYGKAVGEVFWLDESLGGLIPPTDNANFRFIRMTAGDSYNSGILEDESVSGTSPLVVATAQIAVGPLTGKTVHLINTEGRFVRGGTSGVLQDSQNLSHFHTPGAGAFVTNVYPALSSWTFDAVTGNCQANGGNTANSGGDEARPRNISFSAWMRTQ